MIPPMMPPTRAPMLRDESGEHVEEEQRLHPIRDVRLEHEKQLEQLPLRVKSEGMRIAVMALNALCSCLFPEQPLEFT